MGSGLKVPFVLKSSPAMWTPILNRIIGNRETLEEFISNLTLIKEDYNAILKKWKA
jgi:hypothetical protein